MYIQSRCTIILSRVHFPKYTLKNTFGEKIKKLEKFENKKLDKSKNKIRKKLKKKVGKGRQKVEKTWGKVEEQKIGGKLENKNGKS